ncbi:TIGR02221 family CRISPR-associated protein [Acetomicrobium sp.]|uniref:TIGR02221 family CRISPR-associated protein n=1 Tax=Acetomicrobium sp. TaxID=1872099 RepID=UPI002FC91DA8
MKVLTFLGTGRYEDVTYEWPGKEPVSTHLFPEAVARIFEPEKLLVFVTETAKKYKPPCGEQLSTTYNQTTPRPKEDKTYLEVLRDRLGTIVEPVDIPEGRSEAELWEIFDRVASTVNEGDKIVLDITHAFRSIPMLVLTIAAYLRRTKGVIVEYIVYGAYEARKPFNNPPNPEDRAPIFDLTQLLDLLDWISGAEFLLQRSDAILLAERLRNIHQRAWQSRSSNDELPRRLQTVATKLQSLSQALQLARPRDAMQYAHDLLPLLNQTALEVKRWAKPFAVILEQIRSEATKFAHKEPEHLDKDNLGKQLAIIEHFVEKGLLIQAVLLAREWVVNWTALQHGKGDWLNRNYREQEIEKTLGVAAKECWNSQANVPEWFNKLINSDEVAGLWNELTNLRNDLAHCGMRREVARIQNIEQRTREILKYLSGLLNNTPGRTIYGGRIVIDFEDLYGDVAKLDELPNYLERAKVLAGEGNEVVLTGQAPIWLYLAVAHAIHGKARRLLYSSPTTGEVLIFDHSA